MGTALSLGWAAVLLLALACTGSSQEVAETRPPSVVLKEGHATGRTLGAPVVGPAPLPPSSMPSPTMVPLLSLLTTVAEIEPPLAHVGRVTWRDEDAYRVDLRERAMTLLELPLPLRSAVLLDSRSSERPRARTLVPGPGDRFIYEAVQYGVAQAVHRGESIVARELSAIPVLRLLDAATGADTLFAEPAVGPAWASDGRIAYLQLVDEHHLRNQAQPKRIVVQASLHEPAAVWTTEPAAYAGLIWAGSRLLVLRGHADPHRYPRTDLLVLDGPDSMRVLAESAYVVALSPDGTRALVTYNDAASLTPELLQVWSTMSIALIRIQDGMVLDQLRLPKVGVHALGADGHWVNDRVVVHYGYLPDGPIRGTPLMVVLNVAHDRVRFEHQFGLAEGDPPRIPRDRGPAYARWLDADHSGVGLWFIGYPAWDYAECDLQTESCLRSPALGWGFVENRSRPWPAGEPGMMR